MKHDYCRCHCSHSPDQHDANGRCQSGDDDGDGYFDECYCDEYWCNYAGKQFSGTVRGGCVKAPRCDDCYLRPRCTCEPVMMQCDACGRTAVSLNEEETATWAGMHEIATGHKTRLVVLTQETAPS